MRTDIKKAADTIANFAPGLIGGVQLEFFSKFNITNSQFITLMAVFYADGCTMGYLAKSLHVTRPTVTGLVDRLIKLGLVQRITSAKDRRKVYIELSRKGRDLIEEFKIMVRHRWSKLLAPLSNSEVKMFQKIFKDIGRNLEIQKNEAEK